ncbi:hypothetical protein PIB30_094402 [Stylosanthes scabra]|uniref:Uncharacterized protein n=1 Tax=Stylosanthes scabra TaxID=79078 RepID=A0ABU6ZU09_9FABA|nr:hypothetical protein [Stylosanthes scabra]
MEAQGIPVTIANLAIHRHREEEMNQERMRYDQILQEAETQQEREANKGKTRGVVPDSEEEEGSEELHSSDSEEWSQLGTIGSHPRFLSLTHALVGSGVIFYEYEKREKFEDFDMKADAELGTFKIRRYHLDDKAFVHPLRSVRIDPDLSVRESGTRSAILRLEG